MRAEGNVENGGYPLRVHLGAGIRLRVPRTGARARTPEIFEPRTRETDAISRLYQPLEALTRLINDTPPDRLEQALGALLDLPALVRFLAVQRVAGEIDGFVGNWGMSNFYLYRFRDRRPAQVLPWDADHAFWAVDMPIDYRLETNVLTRSIMAVPALRRLYLETLVSVSALVSAGADADGRGWLEQEANRLALAIAPLVAADPVTPFTIRGIRRQRPGPPRPAPHPPPVCRLRRPGRPRPGRAAILSRAGTGRDPAADAQALTCGGPQSLSILRRPTALQWLVCPAVAAPGPGLVTPS